MVKMWTCNECNVAMDRDYCIYCGSSRPELQQCINCKKPRGSDGLRCDLCRWCGHEWGVPILPVDGIPITDDVGRAPQDWEPVPEGQGRWQGDAEAPSEAAGETAPYPSMPPGETDPATADKRCGTIMKHVIQCYLWVMIPLLLIGVTVLGWGKGLSLVGILVATCVTVVLYGTYVLFRVNPSAKQMKLLLAAPGCGRLLFYVVMTVLTLEPIAVWMLKCFGPASTTSRDTGARCTFIIRAVHQVAIWILAATLATLHLTVYKEGPYVTEGGKHVADRESYIPVTILLSLALATLYLLHLIFRLIPERDNRMQTLLATAGCGKVFFYIVMTILALELPAALLLDAFE